MIPRRIQLQRTRGWRMPANTSKVDRTGKWGYPFPVGPARTAAEAVELFRNYLLETPGLLAAARATLKGRNLGCWCKPGAPCHADVLLQLANAPRVGQCSACGKTDQLDGCNRPLPCPSCTHSYWRKYWAEKQEAGR